MCSAETWNLCFQGDPTYEKADCRNPPVPIIQALDLKRPPVQRQQTADWDSAVVRAFNELTRSELDEFTSGKAATQVRKIVAAFRMETELNAVAAKLVEHSRPEL